MPSISVQFVFAVVMVVGSLLLHLRDTQARLVLAGWEMPPRQPRYRSRA